MLDMSRLSGAVKSGKIRRRVGREEVLSEVPHSVHIGKRRLTDHEKFMMMLRNEKYREIMNSIEHDPDDDDFDDEDLEDHIPPTEAEIREEFSSFERVRRKLPPENPPESFPVDDKSISEPPLPLE